MKLRWFKRKPKSYLIDDKYEVIPAFEWQGDTYYMHKDPLNTSVGRGLTSLVFMEELLMRCDISYLKDYISAVKGVLSNPKGIDILALATLTNHMHERVNLLAAIPEHVYKMASVTFFNPKTESHWHYDHEEGRRKIELWKQTPGMYDFFLQTPLKDLIPSLALPDNSSKEYLEVVQKIDDLHIKTVRDILSNKESTAATPN